MSAITGSNVFGSESLERFHSADQEPADSLASKIMNNIGIIKDLHSNGRPNNSHSSSAKAGDCLPFLTRGFAKYKRNNNRMFGENIREFVHNMRQLLK